MEIYDQPTLETHLRFLKTVFECVLLTDAQSGKTLFAFGSVPRGHYRVRKHPLSLQNEDGSVLGCFLQLFWEDREETETLYRDSLTQVYNRRFFDERVFLRHIRAELPCEMVFLMADLFQFKEINDTYGHPAGDKALRSAAEAIRGMIRSEDMVIRMGGDEFLLVMPHATESAAKRVCNSLRTKLKYNALCDTDEEKRALNVGYAHCMDFDGSEECIRSMYERSDASMYADKNGEETERPS